MSKSLAEKVDPRFLKEDGLEAYSGCELILKGLFEVEGGSHLWTGYPGSPVAGFFDAIELVSEIPRFHGIHATIANNEALAVAMLNGSQMMGLRGIAVMKSVGVHVAADALALGNLAGAHQAGGAVVVLGDDPWSDSTQVPSDSRFLCKHLFVPVIEPSEPQEIKDLVDVSFKLSRASGFYVGYLVTTNQADGGGTVRVKKNQWPEINTHHRGEICTRQIPVDETVLLPPRTGLKEEQLESRRQQLWRESSRLGLDRVLHPTKNAPLGFITSGLAFTYLQHALSELGWSGRFPILKLGLTYPIDPQILQRFAGQVQRLVVIEERRGFIEEQVTTLLSQWQIANGKVPPPIWGKKFPDGDGIPSTLGLNPSILIEKLTPLISKYGEVERSGKVERELELLKLTQSVEMDIPKRTPTFCPGCPHRDSSSILNVIKTQFRSERYMRKQHGRQPVDLVFHGDTGCYTMLMFPPNKELMHNYSGMGLGGATGAGIDSFIVNKQVVFMGDSTFFHSGLVSISNSIKNRQDITYIILDNQTTAMTGHQTTPGLDKDLIGRSQHRQNMDRIVEAMMGLGHADVVRVNPSYRDSYQSVLESTILRDGVKVVIADKECGITYHRRAVRKDRALIRKKGYLPKKSFINITPEVCEFCLECTKATGCPGLTFQDTAYGTKMQTDLSWCVSDGACTRTRACPSFEEVIVTRKNPAPSRLDGLRLEHLPAPVEQVTFSDSWHAYLAGVGGMGIGVSTATLVRAGIREGYHILYCDKKGLAIRNGGVYSQISFSRSEKTISNQIPYGKADLILGIDILETARGLDPKGNQRAGSSKHTSAVVNTEKTPTILTLLGEEDFDPASLEKNIRLNLRPEGWFGFNFSYLAEKYLGSKIFANVLLLGAAFQKGWLPLKLESLIWAIEHTMGPASKDNISAFQLGRKVVLDPTRFLEGDHALRYRELLDRKAQYFEHSHSKGERTANAYRHLMQHAEKTVNLPEPDFCNLAIRIADLIWYENAAYAKKYLDVVKTVFSRDTAEYDFAATRAVIRCLSKVMLIKDEVYVAHLLTSREKLDRDRERYHVDLQNGDAIRYVHINRPHFDIGPFKLEFDIKTYNWQLNLVKRFKLLRKLLPQWHRSEKQFRDEYLQIASQFSYEQKEQYSLWLEILRCPESVKGYRHIRQPLQNSAVKRMDELLAQLDPQGIRIERKWSGRRMNVVAG